MSNEWGNDQFTVKEVRSILTYHDTSKVSLPDPLGHWVVPGGRFQSSMVISNFEARAACVTSRLSHIERRPDL